MDSFSQIKPVRSSLYSLRLPNDAPKMAGTSLSRQVACPSSRNSLDHFCGAPLIFLTVWQCMVQDKAVLRQAARTLGVSNSGGEEHVKRQSSQGLGGHPPRQSLEASRSFLLHMVRHVSSYHWPLTEIIGTRALPRAPSLIVAFVSGYLAVSQSSFCPCDRVLVILKKKKKRRMLQQNWAVQRVSSLLWPVFQWLLAGMHPTKAC